MKKFMEFLVEAEDSVKTKKGGGIEPVGKGKSEKKERETEISPEDIEAKRNQSEEEHKEDAEKGEEVDAKKKKVAIDSFMAKILSAKTIEGLEELEAFYLMRREEVKLDVTDDIAIRDAIEGRRAELDPEDDEAEEF